MRSWAEVDVAEPSHEGTEVRVRACVELFASREPFNMIGARSPSAFTESPPPILASRVGVRLSEQVWLESTARLAWSVSHTAQLLRRRFIALTGLGRFARVHFSAVFSVEV